MRLPRLVSALVLGVTLGAPAHGAARAHAAARIDPMGDALTGALSGLESTLPPATLVYDRILPLSGIERFDGSATARAIDRATWRQLYDELRRSARATSWPAPDALSDAARRERRQGLVSLAVVDADYVRLRDDALATGAVRVAGDRLVAGEGIAWRAGRAFAATALTDRTARGADVRFVLSRDRWFSSPGVAPPRSLRIDCGDGLGPRALRFDEPVAARYTRTGVQDVRVVATLANGERREAAFAFRVEALAVPDPDDTLHVTATVPYQGQLGSGNAYVYRAPGHATLTRPAVVVEGFDLDNDMDWDDLYLLLNQQGLLDSLRVDGFDAVVLDFTDATDYIQKNAFVLTELLSQVEAAVPPSTTVALAGASMGGLVSRYALAWLESQGTPARVRTFISFDAPQAGADIPLGVQYWVDFFSGQSADAAHLRDLLNRPAARQMLVHHFTVPPTTTGQPDPLRAGLIADLAAVGNWPAMPRRVAIANGSGAGVTQGFGPAAQLIRYEYSSFLATIVGNVWAVPNLASATIFDGRIRILFSDDRRTVTVTGTQPYDGAPGGWRATMTQMDTTAVPYGDIQALHPAHDFIPTISSLSIATGDPFYDVDGDPALLSHTPFDAVYFPTTNQEHVEITAQNAAWLRSEIQSGLVDVPGGVVAPATLALAPVSPNPFHDDTRLEYRLAAAGDVELAVFDVGGRRVARLVSGRAGAGVHAARWDGRDDAGRPLPAGLYLARLAQGGRVATTRLVRLP